MLKIPQRLPRAFRVSVLSQALPIVLRHRLMRPYRRRPPVSTQTITSPHFGTTRGLDAVCELFVIGYAELANRSVSRHTGLLLVLYIEWIQLIDDEFERLVAEGRHPSFEDISNERRAREVWDVMSRVGSVMCGGEDHVSDYLQRTAETAYPVYAAAVNEASRSNSFEAHLAVARVDAGLILRNVYELIRVANGHTYAATVADQYYHTGLAGKFFDDFVDLAVDKQEQAPNLLRPLLEMNPEVAERVQHAVDTRTQMTIPWWRDNGPEVVREHFKRAYEFYKLVDSMSLRLIVDLHIILLYSKRYWASLPSSQVGADNVCDE